MQVITPGLRYHKGESMDITKNIWIKKLSLIKFCLILNHDIINNKNLEALHELTD